MKGCEKDLQGLRQSWEFSDNSNSVSFDVSQEVCHACHAIGCSCSEMRSDVPCQQAVSNLRALADYMGKLGSDRSKQAVEPVLYIGSGWYKTTWRGKPVGGPPR